MLTRQRHERILELLRDRGSITVTEIRDILGISESTARRDITALDREGRLVKVFGGAVEAEQKVTALEYTVAEKSDLNREEKDRIAAYAASLITDEDFVYLDAGTTTSYLISHLEATGAVFVTNGVVHAQKLAALGRKVFLVGGELKSSTEAVIGNQAMLTLRTYHFTVGFFGANGVSRQSGCTTPDANEALVKQTAMKQCRKSYVLCDHSKFDQVSSVTFAPFSGTAFITDRKLHGYEDCSNMIVV